MKKSLEAIGCLLLAILSALSTLHAQQTTYDLTLGPVLTTKPDADAGYLGVDGDKVYKIGNENKKLEYQRLGASMEPEVTAAILSDEDRKKGRRHAFTVMLNGEICKFTFAKDKETVGFRLYGQKVNKQTLLSEGEVKEVAYTDVDGEAVMKGMIDPSRFCFPHRVSEDRQTLAIITYEMLGAESYGSYAEVRMLDHNFNELWKNKGNTKPKSIYAGMTVLGQDEVIIFWTSYAKEENASPVIYQRIGKNGESKALNMSLGEKQYIQNMVLLLDPKHQITLCGFYYEDDARATKGVFVMRLNAASLEITEQLFVPVDFPPSGRDKSITQAIKNIKFLDNGDVLILSQQVSVTKTLPQSGVVGSTYIYTYQDITVLRLNSKAEVVWKSVLPVNQLAYNEYAQFAGFVSMVKGEKIYILLNDHPDNMSITKTGTPEQYQTKRDGKLFLLTVDASGNVTREAFSSQIGEMKLNPSQSIALDDKTLLMYTESGKAYQMDKVVFH